MQCSQDAVIAVSRWMPGLVDNLSSHHGNDIEAVSNQLVEAARQKLQTNAEIAQGKDDLRMSSRNLGAIDEDAGATSKAPSERRRPTRVRIVSTPAGSAIDMFGAAPTNSTVFQPKTTLRGNSRSKTLSTPLNGDMFGDSTSSLLAPGEILLNVVDTSGKKYSIKVMGEVYEKIKGSKAPLMLTDAKDDSENVGTYLDGFVRMKSRDRSLSNVSR